MRVSIHQPCFLPYLGFFEKFVNSDKFLAFDHVKAPGGRSWISRNKILLNGKPIWLTVPVERKFGQLTKDIRIAHSHDFQRKHLGTLRQAYKKHHYFDEVFCFLDSEYTKKHEFILEFNLSLIMRIAEKIGLSTNVMFTSEMLLEENLGGNELVLEICKSVAAKHYISGDGCKEFIKPDTFKENNIVFEFLNWKPRAYEQLGVSEFVPNLSVVDCLFNIGFDGLSNLLRLEQ